MPHEPAKGRPVLRLNWLLTTRSAGRRGLIVSLEMRDTELVLRMLCGLAEVDSRDVRGGRLTDAHRKELHTAAEDVGRLPLRIWAPPAATIAEIRRLARHTKATIGLELLVVDYLGLVRPAGDEKRLPRYEQVGIISAGLKQLAKELGIVVVALAQLNREAEDGEPKLSQLRESGSIEQDADAVLLIHHPQAKQASSAATAPSSSDAFVIVAKHRHGQICRVRLVWHPTTTSFTSPQTF